MSEFADAGVLVLFGQNAPPELAEFAVLHDGSQLDGAVCPGDRITLGSDTFRVLAVGEVANQNLGALGHLVLKFNGKNAPEMPGDVCAEARPLPNLEIGMNLEIEGEE